jgi:hypothetical protein
MHSLLEAPAVLVEGLARASECAVLYTEQFAGFRHPVGQRTGL